MKLALMWGLVWFVATGLGTGCAAAMLPVSVTLPPTPGLPTVPRVPPAPNVRSERPRIFVRVKMSYAAEATCNVP